jgi:hypothetical protein
MSGSPHSRTAARETDTVPEPYPKSILALGISVPEAGL